MGAILPIPVEVSTGLINLSIEARLWSIPVCRRLGPNHVVRFVRPVSTYSTLSALTLASILVYPINEFGDCVPEVPEPNILNYAAVDIVVASSYRWYRYQEWCYLDLVPRSKVLSIHGSTSSASNKPSSILLLSDPYSNIRYTACS